MRPPSCTAAAFGYAERFGEKETLELINKLAGREEGAKSAANPAFPGSEEERANSKAKGKYAPGGKAKPKAAAPAVEVSDPVVEKEPEKLIVEG